MQKLVKTILLFCNNCDISIKGKGKAPSTSFSPVGSTNWCKISRSLPSASPKLLNLNQDHPSKEAAFQVKSLKN